METAETALTLRPGEVAEIMTRARAAQRRFEAGATQARYDRAALAAAWSLMAPARNQALSEMAVRLTGLGKVADKVTKNHRKTLGLLRDIRDQRTCGVIRDLPERGLTDIARPLGVVAAVVPSTNPLATPVNNAVNALKCGNAIVLSPSPAGSEVCAALLDHMHQEFAKAGVDPNLVQMLPRGSGKAETQSLMELADLVVVTGSQDNVRRAYSSGRPAIGVGAGNATVIIDETADIKAAAEKIAASKCFDNATSCSSENALIVVDAVHDALVAELARQGGHLLTAVACEKVVAGLWQEGRLNRVAIAKDAEVLLTALGLAGEVTEGTRFLLAPETGVGPEHPLSGEKLSLVAALYRVPDFAAAKDCAGRILAHQGAGHSLGIHTSDAARPLALGLELPVCRVIVNQAHCFATGGSFDNGMPFSLSMGCGSWGGNSIDENLHWRHFLNITKVVRTIPPEEPALEEIFGGYWQEVGR